MLFKIVSRTSSVTSLAYRIVLYGFSEQITPIAVKACNLILKERKSPKRYTLSDRKNPTKSKEMFTLYQRKYNPSNNVDDGIRMWNCGISARKDKSKGRKYLNKVKKYMNGGK